MKEVVKMATIKIYLPYSNKAINFLRTIEKKYGATWMVDENEVVTIQASTEKKIEKIKLFFKKTLDKSASLWYTYYRS